MKKDKNSRDEIFAGAGLPGEFVFDENVAAVFDDMINRSVPGYSTIIAMIGVLAERYGQAGSRLYDLGCSLGGATLAMARKVDTAHLPIIAIDNSSAMLARLEEKLAAQDDQYNIQCQCADVSTVDITEASVVVLNFTLQFIPLQERTRLLEKIYAGMRPGGILIISEKILFPDADVNALFVDLYHQFKETMGYSKLEISRKRAALENVLLPETIATHRKRLTDCGFHSVDLWFQCFNFASMVAFK